MKGRLILVGASGGIGSAALAEASVRGLVAISTYHTRAIPEGIRFSLGEDVPETLGIQADDAVIIFAAFSDQEWVRTHPRESHRLNVAATARLAETARRRKAFVIFMSSEAVFGRNRDVGWTEVDMPCPATEYGWQKYEMEKILKGLGGSCVVRTGWNVTCRPNDRCVIRSTYESLLDRSARLAEDNVFSLTDVDDTARLLIQVAVERVPGVVHAVSGVPTARTSMADEIIKKSVKGRKMSYERIHFSDLTLKEPKPACSWLTATHELDRRIPAFSLPPDIVAKKVRILDADLTT